MLDVYTIIPITRSQWGKKIMVEMRALPPPPPTLQPLESLSPKTLPSFIFHKLLSNKKILSTEG